MFGIKLSPWIIAIGAVGLLVLAAYFYYQRSENEKAELRSEISVLKENEVKYLFAIDKQKETIAFLEDQQERLRKDFIRTQEQFAKTRAENIALGKKLKDLNLAKSGMENAPATELLINDLQRNMNRCIDLTTGASLSEKELGAKTAEEFNPECKFLFKK